MLIGITTATAPTPLERVIVIDITNTRTDGTAILGGFDTVVNITCLSWARGAGTADGLLSATHYSSGLSGA